MGHSVLKYTSAALKRSIHAIARNSSPPDHAICKCSSAKGLAGNSELCYCPRAFSGLHSRNISEIVGRGGAR